MTVPRFVGIDAGGTSTVCLVGDDRATLGRGTAGPANPSLVGVDGFRTAIAESADAALQDLTAAPIASAWLGVAGSERPGLRDRLRAVAREALGAELVEISHDARLVLAAAEVDHGIALVAGTGSSAYARSGDGRELRLGGWGHLLGDEGGGYDIAVKALRAVTAAADGRGPRTALEQLLPGLLGVAGPAALGERCYPAPPVHQIASLARTVVEAADHDEVSASIVRAAAGELAGLVDACAERLFGASSAGPVPVVLSGGMLSRGSRLHLHLVELLEREPGRYHLITPTREPAAGALTLARAGPREPPS